MTAATLLLEWYDRHRRALPWRESRDPYAIWVSETMLQQTRVSTVLSYYSRFLQAFPDISALAAAPEDEVLKLWEGLGYYSRARNLHRGAQQVAEEYGGALPHTVEELKTIRGIGPYTAGAIASIAFGEAVPAVDGNVIRVVSRLAGIRENVGIPSVRRQLEAAAAALVPKDRPGDFNQAVMDLGSAVCVPGTPDCGACPLRDVCDARANGDAEDLPELPRKNPPREICWDVALVLSHGRVLMRRRTEALLNGLWIYPMTEGHQSPAAITRSVKKATGLQVRNITFHSEAKHVFSHQIWRMRIHICRCDETEAPVGWRFVSREEMAEIALPTAVRAATDILRNAADWEALAKPEKQ